MSNVNRLSVTVTTPRQTPKNEFGQVLKNTLTTAVNLGSKVVGGLAGMPIVSAAVSGVTALAGGASAGGGTARAAQAATGIINVGGASAAPNGVGTAANVSVGTTYGAGAGAATGGATVSGAEPAGFDSYLSQMRAESDRSMAMQMQMQQESRDYNTLSNVLKLRHDSAKAAINNIR